MKKILFVAVFSLFAGKVASQVDTMVAVRKDDRLRISGGEKFDFVFSRTFLVPGNSIPADTVPLNVGSSGTYTLGLGFGVPIGRMKKLALRWEPRVAWHVLNFRQTDQKTFPTDSGNVYIYEKMRGFYLESPIGFRFNLARNEDKKIKYYFDIGFNPAVLATSSYKRRYGSGFERVTQKYHEVWGMYRFRYGPYVRIGTRVVALNASYRLSDVFSKNKTYSQGRTFPEFPKLEVGIALTF